ncbi:MAG: histidine kinase [Casimicrobium sp.]
MAHEALHKHDPALVQMKLQQPPFRSEDAIALALSEVARNNALSVARAKCLAWVARCGGQVLLQKRGWQNVVVKSFRDVSWGKMVFVLLATMVIAVQSVLPAASLMYWSAGQLLRVVIDNFVEGLIVASAMFLGGSILLAWTRPRGFVRIVLIALAMMVFALMGCAISYWLTYDAGFFPPPSFIAANTLRWTIIGGLLFLIDDLIEQRRQNASRQREGETRVANLGRQAAEARLQLMQAQIEPHFLFNTLANVKRLCATDPDGGADLFSHLMVYLRAALPRLRETESTLETELSLARSFLSVLKIRMGTRLQFTIEVPEACLSLPFPSMALLTLVENAVKHGLAPAREGGSISICGEQQNDRFCVTVADTGVGFSAKGGSGMGIANTRNRLAAAYGTEAELVLAANSPRGVVASIKLPLKLMRRESQRRIEGEVL